MDLHAGPVRLTRHQAVRLEQVGHQRFLHWQLVAIRLEQFRRGAVVVDFHIQPVQQHAVQLAHGDGGEGVRQGQRHMHVGAKAGRQVLLQQGLERVRAVEAGLVERVQVQLERLGLDDVGRIGRHREAGDGHLRLAPLVQPRQFIGVPDVDPEEGQRTLQAQLVALALARDGEQQFGRVIGAVGGSLA